MSVIYEVNLAVEPAIEDEFADWLQTHVAEMLALPGFEAAETLLEEGPPDQPVFSVRYRLRDRDALDEYFEQHAARMRADGVARFGGAFRASRRILRRIG